MKHPKHTVAAALFCWTAAAAAEVATYDGVTGMLSLPAVKVGAATYTGVTLENLGNFTFQLRAAEEEFPPGPAAVSYDGGTGLVSIPAVRVGSTTYIDVTLRHEGNWRFTLQAASELPAATQSEVNALFAANDALFATGTQATGAARFAMDDSCYLGDGKTKAYLVSDYDGQLEDRRAREAYRIGQTTGNIQVAAVRNLVNVDGSARREIDVEYDINYTDGTASRGETATLISGSPAGSPNCASPQVASQLRFYGNRQLVQIIVRGRNIRDQRYLLSNGAPASPALNYRRDVQFVIIDPMGNATYAIVEGPGPGAQVNGAAAPFSLKFISPWLLRSAPELAGKNQNFLNWLDDDGFRYCRVTGNGVPAASVADCVGLGAAGNNWGWTTSTPNNTADGGFLDQGWKAGGWYTISVYNDDGWKTINGHVGRTPIAVYQQQLKRLPYSFIEMAGTGPSADKFPRISLVGQSIGQLQAAVTGAVTTPVNLTWTALPALSDGRKFGLFQLWEFFQGPRADNPGGALFPGYRSIFYGYPGSTTTSINNLLVHPKLPEMSTKTYAEFTFDLRDRNDSSIQSIVSFN